jgi:pyruvate/2-oxoglutarate dehydrogenase complex dihydrolipoamide dehydrogenase (E3) component
VKKLKEEDISYINAKASFADANSVSFQYKGLFEDSAVDYNLKAKHFVIATGCRPRAYPGIP